MRYLKTYKLFEFVETQQNTPTLYKDDNLEVKVSKTFDSTKQQNKNTSWCSSSPVGFYGHNKTANMYRINFKDGYKLRLTWDYIPQNASELGFYSGGTHWGQGGIVDGEKKYYDVFRPRDNEDPFYIDWQSETKREIVDRIKSIPDDAKLAMMEYQEKMTKEKSELITRAFKEIEQIKVINVEPSSRSEYLVTVNYRGKKYVVNLSNHFFSSKELVRDIKNKYALVGNALPKYLNDKTKEFLKKKKVNENISNSDLKLDVKDMLLELEDSGYQVDVDMRPQGVDMFCVEVSNDKLFQWSDIKEYFERAKNYTCENGWELKKIHVNSYGSYSSRIKEFMNLDSYDKFIDFVDNEEFIKNNKIYDIAFIFDPKK